ncbi:MAG: hypothetical protein MMC33_003677 [Icmadophila ericetorum]|nr:hypothetical protein [Icmadophila ericetorum]
MTAFADDGGASVLHLLLWPLSVFLESIMLFTPLIGVLGLLCSSLPVSSLAIASGGKPNSLIKPYENVVLQDIVTWDQHSIFVRGERVLLYNGEFHPHRLPVPGLWLDVFQKIQALGFSGVSFYVDWALLEGQEGNFTAEGVFAFEPFFQAASEAGIYLVARPGPYINAESSGGGYPGWLARYKAIERTPSYVPLSQNYAKNIGKIIAKAQITNGGPIILVQAENEYSQATPNILFPNHQYFAEVEQQLRNAGIVVPFVSNDAYPHGYFAPGTGLGAVDIYGHDGYPLGFDCANPYTWPNGDLPTYYHELHLEQSPSTPYTISEFQGGSFDPWGGTGFEKCATLLNQEFERVFYKNNYAVGVTIFNLYMIYGGTNWGNLGYAGGYTSYDYGAAIAEDRTVTREKYSEVKLEANFLQASPDYLTAVPGNSTAGAYVNTAAITTTRLTGNVTSFFVVRQSAYNSLSSQQYRWIASASEGTFSVPQLSPTLVINGRDSKFHVIDYMVGNYRLVYSSAEIFTWKQFASRTVLVAYGGPNETHEIAFAGSSTFTQLEGSAVTSKSISGSLVINWAVTAARKVLRINNDLYVYLLDRNDAYNYWVLNLPGSSPADNFTVPSASPVIVRAGYLLRTASVKGNTISLTGDINCTTAIEIVGGSPAKDGVLLFNGKTVATATNSYGVLSGTVTYTSPKLALPTLSSLDWRAIDSLPEIQPTYDDSEWPNANIPYSNNTVRNLTTPVSLYSQDYGFSTGNLLFRGHFTSTGVEKALDIVTQGGTAYAVAVYLNSTFLGSWPGNSARLNWTQTLTLPALKAGQKGIFTVLIDNMGLDEDGTVGSDGNKNPRGILDYTLFSRPQTAISWKITGNLGGEDYRDRTRGPLNEGGLYAERQGYHLPAPPTSDPDWTTLSPTTGIVTSGVSFYTTRFTLKIPTEYDIPLSFVFTNTSSSASSSHHSTANFRSQLYVNGYQFGKYVNNIGPQTSFPVPEGILNYQGENWVAVSLWALDSTGAKIPDLRLVQTAEVMSGYSRPIVNSPMPAWSERAGAY